MTRRPDDAAVDGLRTRLRGDALQPGDDGYDDARAVWNGMIDRFPALIVRCRGASDVIAALDFAAHQGMDFAVKGGGHSVAGHSAIDDGLLVDLSQMNDVRVDPARKTARVGAGALLADLDHEAQAFGLATPAGVVSLTGVAGLTLGGGKGHLSRAYGLTCDNLRSADVVTADGRLVHASAEENADLFWAIRGGGGNFGVVTSFEFNLHEVGPEILGGPIFYPFDQAGNVMAAARDLMANAPDEVGCLFGFMTFPPEEPFPQSEWGQLGAFLVPTYAGSVEEGERALAPLRAIGEPILDGVGPLPYVALQQAFDAGNPDGNRYYWRAELLEDLSDEAIEAMIRFLTERPFPSPFSTITIEVLGGAVARVPTDATAYPHRDAMYDAGFWGNWVDPADDGRNTAWIRDCHAAVAPHATGGVYVNYLDSDEDDRIRAAFGENFDRLARVKARWDPENRFSNTKNIAPAT
jgi:FAD/FMN-containing dehydrogenase